MDGRRDGDGQRPLSDVPGLPRGRVRPGAPRVAALDALLRDVDALRTGLQTDLSLAAGALEAGEPDLAASVLDSDRHDVAAFERRALAHLAALQAADAAEAAAAAEALGAATPRSLGAPPARARVRRLPRRLTRLLPAAPLVAAAAALVGLLGPVPGSATRQAPPTDVSGAVLSSWAELARLSASDAPADQVQRAARSLNADIASMVARADGDPAAARQALALLRQAQAVLQNDDDAAELTGVLEQSKALAARLLAGLPPLAPGTLPGPPQVGDRLPEASAPARPLPRAERRATAPRPRASSETRPAAEEVPRPRRSSAPSSTPSARPTPAPSSSAVDPVLRPSRPPSLPTAAIEPPVTPPVD